VNRRRRIVAAGAGALTLPWAARAQRPALPVIGYLSGVSRAESEDRLAAFRRGLGQA
jgi:putative ABC transport system substrate-binding protein